MEAVRNWPLRGRLLRSMAVTLIRGAGRVSEVVAFEKTVVAFFLEAAELLGVPRSVAAIYGICFASPEPLSFVDINERLEISQGSISQGLRVLREMGALRVVLPAEYADASAAWVKLDIARDARRKEYFTPDLELRKLAERWIEQRLDRQLKAGRARLRTMKETVPPDRNGSAKELRSRLKSLETWHNQSRALVPVIKTFLKIT
jgi:HTH-type transcriptional regulator, glycine betaine synthesis regulator